MDGEGRMTSPVKPAIPGTMIHFLVRPVGNFVDYYKWVMTKLQGGL